MVLLLQYTLIFASVLLLVALGGCFAERSGVINIGLEGIMCIGALGGALVMKFMPVTMGAPVIVICTILAAALFGLVFSLTLAVAAINFKADQTITGTAMNMLATAGATVAVKAMNTAASGGNDVSSDIAYTHVKDFFIVRIGSFEFSWFMLVAVICLAVSFVFLYKTKSGLRLRACGEHPQAADSVGINVYKIPVELPEFKLWMLDEPNLYQMHVQVFYKDQLRDNGKVSFLYLWLKLIKEVRIFVCSIILLAAVDNRHMQEVIPENKQRYRLVYLFFFRGCRLRRIVAATRQNHR